ncbi:LacI family transcriptional regulator [Flavonifractor plautii]|nr:LacI family transcriptional regulator [Flavonifractor plautii]
MRAPTISEVAKTAGVSVATVSRVVNGSPSVSHETQARVQEAIERLGYQPNVWGRSLRRGESRVVLVIVPNVSNPYYAPIIAGTEDRLHETATAACCASPMPRRSAGRFTWNF